MNGPVAVPSGDERTRTDRVDESVVDRPFTDPVEVSTVFRRRSTERKPSEPAIRRVDEVGIAKREIDPGASVGWHRAVVVAAGVVELPGTERRAGEVAERDHEARWSRDGI